MSYEKLTRSSDFSAVFADELAVVGEQFVARLRLRGDDGPCRVGLAVSGKYGKAVARNRIKRLMREALQANAGQLPDGVDVVLIPRQGASVLDHEQGGAAVIAALAALFSRVRRQARSAARRA